MKRAPSGNYVLCFLVVKHFAVRLYTHTNTLHARARCGKLFVAGRELRSLGRRMPGEPYEVCVSPPLEKVTALYTACKFTLDFPLIGNY